jgi:peptide/nickel transport system permease protein
VIWKHGLRNALLPIVTVIGFNFGFVLTGSVLVETVFGWPGIGRLLFESLGARDYPVMLAIFIVGAITAIAANLITDLVYAVLDPRIRY